jgi:hypothetical protein
MFKNASMKIKFHFEVLPVNNKVVAANMKWIWHNDAQWKVILALNI